MKQHMEKFKTIVVEDVSLELKGTLSIIRNDIPEVEVIGTAQTEREFWALMDGGAQPDLVLLDLGLGGSTTVGVDICRKLTQKGGVKVLIFTGELLNEKLWADVLDAGAHGIVLKTGELLTRNEIMDVMRTSYSSMLDSNSEAALEKMMPKMPYYMAIGSLIYCFIWGWLYATIFAKSAAPDDPFSEPDEQIDNQ